MSLLDLQDVRELEDMVIQCVYIGLLSARLDNKQQQLIVEYVASRDFRVEDAGKLFDQLKKWVAHVDGIEKMVGANMSDVSKKLEESAKQRAKVQDKASIVHSEAVVDVEEQRRIKRPGRMFEEGSGFMRGEHEHGHGFH